MSLGTRHIDDALTFYVTTTRFDTGVATDADSPPTYRVYEDETATPLLTGTMALLDSSNTAGLYSEGITLSAANGFEVGKSYTIYITGAVNSVTGATERNFVVRGDSYARLGAPAGASVSADILSVDNLVDDLESRLGTPSNLGGGATIAANLADIEGQTDDIGAAGAGLTALATAAALATAQTSIDDLPTNAELNTALGTADDAVLTAIGDLPTNAELATALGTADDAVLAAIAALDAKVDTIDNFLDLEIAAILAAVDTEIAAIKAKTDPMTYTATNFLQTDLKKINGTTVAGDGAGTPWGP